MWDIESTLKAEKERLEGEFLELFKKFSSDIVQRCSWDIEQIYKSKKVCEIIDDQLYGIGTGMYTGETLRRELELRVLGSRTIMAGSSNIMSNITAIWDKECTLKVLDLIKYKKLTTEKVEGN